MASTLLAMAAKPTSDGLPKCAWNLGHHADLWSLGDLLGVQLLHSSLLRCVSSAKVVWPTKAPH